MFEDLIYGGSMKQGTAHKDDIARCPYCGSLNITKSISKSLGSNMHEKTAECKACHKQWSILYNARSITSQIILGGRKSV